MTDKSDRALLEAAALAAGLLVQGDEASGLAGFMGLSIREDDYPSGYCWNPLRSDADAFRLAVKLRLYPIVEDWSDGPWVFVPSMPGHAEPLRPDPYAATRRAVVRAAAALAPTTGADHD